MAQTQSQQKWMNDWESTIVVNLKNAQKASNFNSFNLNFYTKEFQQQFSV